MTLDTIIDLQSVLASLKAPNKKQLLLELSQALAGRVAIDHRIIFETLLKREKLGSTGIGQGIAIPHGKVPTLSRVYGLFARLAAPVDFDSVDGQPVDLVFVLLAPEHAGADHLKALARISRLLEHFPSHGGIIHEELPSTRRAGLHEAQRLVYVSHEQPRGVDQEGRLDALRIEHRGEGVIRVEARDAPAEDAA